MKQPRLTIWIDGRRGKVSSGQLRTEKYYIKDLDDNAVRRKLYAAVGGVVQEIRFLPEEHGAVNIIFNENNVSPSFIDYRLRLLGLKFKRKNGS